MAYNAQVPHNVSGMCDRLVDFSKELAQSVGKKSYVLVAGPAVTLYPQSCMIEQRQTYWKEVFEEIITWCVENRVIKEKGLEATFRQLLHQEAWFPLGYKIEEYLVDKVGLQKCLKEVFLRNTQQISFPLHLSRLSFRGFISTAYDTNIEAAFEQIYHRSLAKFYTSSAQNAVGTYKKGQPFILKLYGDVEHANSLIFGHRWPNGLSSIADHALLRSLISDSAVLFFGFGENDPDYKYLKAIVDNYSPFDQISIVYPTISTKKEPLETQSLRQHEADTDALQEQFLALYSMTIAPVSQVLTLPQASTDIYPQDVQTSSATEHVLQVEALTMDEPPSIEIYTAYAHQDEQYYNDIAGLLETVKLQGWKIYCPENEVVRSNAWRDKGYLTTAHLILLLVSRDFLRSPFCYCDDMKRAVAKHNNGVFILPIMVRPVEAQLKATPFGNLDVIPANRTPISKWGDQDSVYDEIFGEIVKRLGDLKPYIRVR